MTKTPVEHSPEAIAAFPFEAGMDYFRVTAMREAFDVGAASKQVIIDELEKRISKAVEYHERFKGNGMGGSSGSMALILKGAATS